MGMWARMVEKAKDIDAWRKFHLAAAEAIDAWRVVPRMLVIGYAYVMWKAVEWYMSLDNHLIEGCDVATLADKCIVEAPNTQHAILLSTIVGVAAAVFALYTNSGKQWNGFTPWNPENLEEKQRALAPKFIGGRRASDPKKPEGGE